MATVSQTTWARALASPAPEFAMQPLAVLAGQVPEGLRGSLYRNGPGRLERGGIKVGHWFDGDGAILAVHFRPSGVKATYRYVQTKGYQLEEKAGRLLHAGYGMVPPGPFWEQLWYGLKNAANTSVLALEDKLLALWEGGPPHCLDPETLATKGLDRLGGLSAPYSAHPKRDPKSGDIYNFGLEAGPNGILHVYRSDKTGKICQQSKITLQGFPLLHDFVLAGEYLIFCIPPARLNFLPVALYQKSFSDSFEWQPQRGTQILVLDRHTLQVVARGETEPWFQWHFGNGFVDEYGQVNFTVVRYPDLAINHFLGEIATGVTHTQAQGTFTQVTLNPKTAKVLAIRELSERSVDFPTVDPRFVGQAAPYTYLSTQRRGTELEGGVLNSMARYDHHTEGLIEVPIPPGYYPMEPLYCADSLDATQGWILSVVYDSNAHKSEVWIWDAANLETNPVCKLALPSVVPMGFHGTWRGAS